MSIRHILAVLASIGAFLIGCAAGNALAPQAMHPVRGQVLVYIDPEFRDEDVAKIEQAIDAWNSAFRGVVHLAETTRDAEGFLHAYEHHGITLRVTDSKSPFIGKTPKGETGIAWVKDGIGGRDIWAVRAEIPDRDFVRVFMHELGHTFGAQDRDDRGLMHRYTDADMLSCIDEETAREVEQYQRLPTGTVAACR